jgi:inhibitor of cysteine peptidase
VSADEGTRGIRAREVPDTDWVGTALACIQISAAESGKSFAVRVGDELVVSLPENPTTGYRWQLDSPGSLFVVENDDFALPQHAGIGAAGTRLLTLRATAAGRASLHLVLRRDWENDNLSIQDFSASVDIQSR